MRAASVTETVPLVTDSDGVFRVSGTRVTLDTLVYAFQDGATAEEIAQQYPVVPLSDVYLLIGYYLNRRKEVDTYLVRRQQDATEVQRSNEARWDPTAIRARLLARSNERAI